MPRELTFSSIKSILSALYMCCHLASFHVESSRSISIRQAYQLTGIAIARSIDQPTRVMSLLPLFLGPVARVAASAAGRPASAVAAVLHRAGALPRNRGLERLARDDDGVLVAGRGSFLAHFVVGFMRCLC